MTAEAPAPVVDRDLRAVKFFVRLAKHGRPGGSGGEKAARKLALLFLDCGLVLDDLAFEGFVKFMRAAKVSPETARDLIDGWEE